MPFEELRVFAGNVRDAEKVNEISVYDQNGIGGFEVAVRVAEETAKRRVAKEVLTSVIPAIFALPIGEVKIADYEDLIAVRINRDGRLWIIRIAFYVLWSGAVRLAIDQQIRYFRCLGSH